MEDVFALHSRATHPSLHSVEVLSDPYKMEIGRCSEP